MSALGAAPAAIRADAAAGEPARRPWLTVLRWTGTIVLLAIVLSAVNRDQMLSLLAAADWRILPAALGVAVGERVVSTVRWWMLLRAKGFGVGFWPLVGLHMAASFAGSFLPTTMGADAVRVAMLSRRSGRMLDCIAASIVDRMMMVLGTLLAAALAVAAAGALAPQLRWYVIGAAALACGAMAAAASRSLMRTVGGVAVRVLGRTVASKLSRLYWGVYEYRDQRGVLAGGAAVTVSLILIRAVYTWLIAIAMGVEVPLVALMWVLPIAAAVMMLPISVGGLGLQEGVFVVLLGAVGVPPAAAVSVSLVEQVVSRLATAPGAAVLAGGRRASVAGEGGAEAACAREEPAR